MREHGRVAKRREQVHFEKEAPQMQVNEEVERVENFTEPELKVTVNGAKDSECGGRNFRRRGLVGRWC